MLSINRGRGPPAGSQLFTLSAHIILIASFNKCALIHTHSNVQVENIHRFSDITDHQGRIQDFVEGAADF